MNNTGTRLVLFLAVITSATLVGRYINDLSGLLIGFVGCWFVVYMMWVSPKT